MSKASETNDMTVRRSTLITVGAAFIIFILGLPFFWWFSKPSYYPSAIFQPGQNEVAQQISDLSRSSKLCDEAVRSLLLAFAAEMNIADQEASIPVIDRAESLVESKNALVPIQCQNLIDPIATASDRNFEAELVSLKQYRGDLSTQLRIVNSGDEPAFVAIGDHTHAQFSDNQATYFHREKVAGVHKCTFSSCEKSIERFTRIGPGAAASLTIQADAIGSYNSGTVSLALTLIEAKNGEIVGSLSFGFVDVKPD